MIYYEQIWQKQNYNFNDMFTPLGSKTQARFKLFEIFSKNKTNSLQLKRANKIFDANLGGAKQKC